MSNKNLFLFLLLGSFLISNLFWFGTIDQDFFSHYYVGKGFSQGQEIFSDFAGNKGPVQYIFFAILYSIFKDNFGFALIFGSTIIDSISLFIIFKIIQRDWAFKWFRNRYINFTFLGICLLIYKSFSIGTIMGGLYSENLGMLWLVLSLWYLGKKKSFLSGILFSLSVLTRLTYLFFVPFLILEFFLKNKGVKKLPGFFIGGLTPLVIFIVWFTLNGEIYDFFYNTFELNLSYAKTVRQSHLHTIFSVISAEPRILFIMILIAAVLFLSIFSKNKLQKKLALIMLFISSFLATFVGGNFYYHHFFQFNLVSLITISSLKNFPNLKVSFAPILFLIISSVALNYFFYVQSPEAEISHLKHAPPKIKEVEKSQNLLVVPYYPIYYILYDKKSPDKYYSYFFLSSSFNQNNKAHIEKHKLIKKDRLDQTAFLFVTRSGYDKKIIDEYKKNFAKEFNLGKTNEYLDGNARIEIYEPSKR